MKAKEVITTAHTLQYVHAFTDGRVTHTTTANKPNTNNTCTRTHTNTCNYAWNQTLSLQSLITLTCYQEIIKLVPVWSHQSPTRVILSTPATTRKLPKSLTARERQLSQILQGQRYLVPYTHTPQCTPRKNIWESHVRLQHRGYVRETCVHR